jgi:hypothetical protein
MPETCFAICQHTPFPVLKKGTCDENTPMNIFS